MHEYLQNSHCIACTRKIARYNNIPDIVACDRERYDVITDPLRAQIKRRLPQKDASGHSPPLSFSDEIRRELDECVDAFSQLTKTLQIMSKSAIQQAVLLTGTGALVEYLPYFCFWNCRD